jgi:hypothetical protein
MGELTDVAERLRLVRRAQRRFLERAALEQGVIGPMFLDRVAAELERFFVTDVDSDFHTGRPPADKG